MAADTLPPGPQRGRRRAGPGGLRRAGRLRELLVSGVADSFGMALGWTILVLLALSRGGLAEAALYNAAMLAGVVLSAPVTGWISRRFTGRTLLRGAAGLELVLRVAVLWALVAGLPSWLIAGGVVVMHVAAWAGFAAMRAEVTAVAPGAKAMTRYALCIAAVEAAGTGMAALLPAGPAGRPTGWVLIAVFVVYAGSLIPTMVSARRARITPYATARTAPVLGYGVTRPAVEFAGHRAGTRLTASRPGRRRSAVSPRLLVGGGILMLMASGPTLLAVPLTTELHGRAWVAGAAAAFSVGCLLAALAVEVVGRWQLPTVLRWSLWGMGMLIGWLFAASSASMVLVAQFFAGISQTAFEGDMDARVAEEARPALVTTALAYSASTRALGGAAAVKILPLVVTAQAVGTAATTSLLILGAGSLVIWSVTVVPRARASSQSRSKRGRTRDSGMAPAVPELRGPGGTSAGPITRSPAQTPVDLGERVQESASRASSRH